MKKGKLVVFEGIYGTGLVLVPLVDMVRAALLKQGAEVYEIDSPDGGRAQLMGAEGLDSTWRYGVWTADFFFELASRARVCAAVREELAAGKTVLCKHFTLSSIVHAQLQGHDWFREDLNVLEARARGVQLGGEVAPDFTVFVDVPPEAVARQLGPNMKKGNTLDDMHRQRRHYLDEIGKLPPAQVKTIAAESAEAAFPEVLAAVQSALR